MNKELYNISNIFHYIYLEVATTHPFSISHYLSIKSNFIVNKPDTIYFWCNKEPKTRWFDKLKLELGNNLVINIIPLRNEFKGCKIPHMAHQSDILRAEILYDFGGIYSDLDSMAVNPLHELLVYDKIITCPELNKAARLGGKEVGLITGFMMSPKGCSIHKSMLDKYSKYTDYFGENYEFKHGTRLWSKFGVVELFNQYRLHPEEFLVLPVDAFAPYLYVPYDLVDLFVHNNDISHRKIYQIHFWENLSWHKFLKPLTEEYIRKEDTTFTNIARNYLD